MTAASGLCLVEPAAFGYNAEAATTNRFQCRPEAGDSAVATRAREEFSVLVAALRGAGIRIAIAADTPEPAKPDAVFPNNWLSFHDDGTVVVYPMHDPTRRAERREAVIDEVKRQLGFTERRRIDLGAEEAKGRFLEGTGSLVLDRRARIAYACRSPRTDESLVREWARLMDYEPFLFDAVGPDGAPPYHTNVLLWIGERVAGAGLAWVAPSQQSALRARLQSGGRKLLEFDERQLRQFAGNMLEVRHGQRHLVMSAAAAASLDTAAHALLRDAGSIPVVAAVPTIERLGGGSVRCMLAEVPLQSPGAA